MSDYTPGFEKWWKTYPSWRRKDKIKCFLLWQKRHLEERHADLVEKLEADVAWDPAWQKDGKGKQYIPLSHTYLNGGRYDDDKPKPPRHIAAALEPDEPTVELSWQERMLNRLGLNYMRHAFGLPEVKTALKIKHEILTVEAPAVQEDIDAADDKRAATGEAARTLAELFLDRMDQAYGLRFRDTILAAARRK